MSSVVSVLDSAIEQNLSKIALSYESDTITFKQLRIQSQKFANYLTKGRVINDIPLCFCLEQSIEKVVVMLSIWKAGAAYVSLDPSHPEARLQHMLNDTNSPILITTKVLSEKFSFYKGEIILIDEQTEQIASTSSLPSTISIDNGLAYLAYTSGSTGTPKAVMAEHRGLANFVKTFGEFINLEQEDTALQLSSSNFDAMVVDLWIPLTLGLTVYLYPDNRLIGEPLLEYIREKKITVLPYLPIAILATLPVDQSIGCLRKICTGGEAPIVNVIEHWKKKVELINAYGPTEASVAVCAFKFEDSHPVGTIGKPLPNVDFYVLDREMKAAAVNEIGELYIGGIQVCRGYLNQPELTAEKFIDFKSSETKTDRVYKTGDLVRRLDDGHIEFIGRADQQVKIRGFRVEPAEIEENIKQSGLVDNCVVVITGESNEKQLICFYKNKSAYPEDLRSYLFDRLPAYMIPSKFIEMDEFPLTENGKFNKPALVKNSHIEEKRKSLVLPYTALQKQLSAIWSAVLNIKTVGINDNFFQFGGNSILATKLVSKVIHELNIPLHISDLFLHPSIQCLERQINNKDFSKSDGVAELPINGAAHISSQQKALWFINQLHGSTAYNTGALYRLNGQISLLKLENAIRQLLQKHALFRTVIEEEQSLPFPSEISADNWELKTINSGESLTTLLQIPFDLQKDYMLRAYVVLENSRSVSLFLIIHHMVTDGGSMPLIVDEINALYDESHLDIPIEATKFPVYQDYIFWQLRQQWDSGMNFWKDYLQDVPVLQLAHDLKKQSTVHDSGKQFQFEIDEALTDALMQISKDHATTLYTTLISAFGLLMQYYSGQSDICFGSPSANRPVQFEKTIGYFANMLPLRMKIHGNPEFSALLRQNRDMIPKVFQHQHIPLDKIVSHVINDRFAGHNAIFQNVFVFQNPIEETENSQLIDPNEVDWIFNGRTKFDLQFEAFPIANKLKFVIEYADELYSDHKIIEMADAFQFILKSVAASPNQKIAEIKINTVLENEDDDSFESVQIPKTLVELFEDRVRMNPAKTALLMDGIGISYRDLADQSSHVAELLITSGVKSGDFVACFQGQSIDRIITLLGILKSGAAYLPLDITYPMERIRILLADTNAKVLITSDELKAVDQEIDTPVMCIEKLLSTPVEKVRDCFSGTHLPSDLAYVIHTSGTTGVPKGVLVEHQSLGNFIRAYGNLLDIHQDDHTLQFSPLNFDGSVIDLWIPLTKGATIHLYPNNKLLGDHLAAFLSLHAVSVIPFFSPSVLSTLPQNYELPLLRVIGTGGETCPAQVSQYWKHQVKLINVYGPTETTAAVNQFIFDDSHTNNTLGTAIENMRLYVLDQYLRQVPKGVIGDLYISGIQLSKGYLNQPELTAKKFIKNPFIAGEKSIYSKMYATGDQVKMLPDGLLEYIGRADHQVKVRGYRIELAEIENTLCQISGIKSALVHVQSHHSAIQSLRAFVVGSTTISHIKNELNRQLPAYMVPHEIFLVNEIPVKANGKIDLDALGIIALKNSTISEEAEEKPTNAYEKIIKEVWTDVLQCPIKSLDDDFFHLGGHSLLLTKLYNKLFRHFPNKISLGELFVNSTIRKLASVIQERYLTPDVQQYALGEDPLSDEIRKDATIEPGSFKFKIAKKGNFENAEAILLTGVTGFVGVNLLMELLLSNDADIYLLIRADDEEHAKKRLFDAMQEQKISFNLYNEKRIKFLIGDLAKPYLGLTSKIYEELIQLVDVVYHSGSSVNFIQPYSYIKYANVDALHTLIKFVTTDKLKQLVLLSSVGVFSWEHYFTKPRLIMEDADTKSAFKYLSRDMGYTQSKWVMEQIAQEAIKQGVPITIFRLGYVFCHSRTGATAKYQWWSALVKTCIQLKCYPILINQKEELTMVDFVSKAIAHISKKTAAIGKVFQLSPEPENNITVMEFFELLADEFNFDLKPVPYQEWMKLWEDDEDSALYPLLNLFKFKAYDDKSIIEIHQNTPDFDISNTMKFLKDSDIENTVVKRDNVAAFCKYLGLI